MTTPIKARFSNGALVPLEPLDLEEGDEVTVSIEHPLKRDRVAKAFNASKGGWVGLHDPEELKRMIYDARLTGSRQKPSL